MAVARASPSQRVESPQARRDRPLAAAPEARHALIGRNSPLSGTSASSRRSTHAQFHRDNMGIAPVFSNSGSFRYRRSSRVAPVRQRLARMMLRVPMSTRERSLPPVASPRAPAARSRACFDHLVDAGERGLASPSRCRARAPATRDQRVLGRDRVARNASLTSRTVAYRPRNSCVGGLCERHDGDLARLEARSRHPPSLG